MGYCKRENSGEPSVNCQRIDLKDFENLYREEANKVLDYMVQNNIYKIDENETQAIVVTILENLSGCSVTIQNDAYQFQFEDSTIIHEFTEEKIKEKIKLGTENENWKITGVTIPETVKGIVNEEEQICNPFENWGAVGKGRYGPGVQKDEDGRYKIAVGPKILNAEYPDNGRLWDDDFIGYSRKIDVVLEDIYTGEEKIIECVASDLKAHSYNKYPDEQPYNTGDVASFDVENGIIQTGIAYPRSSNARDSKACSTEHMGGSIIEFAGQEIDFAIDQYRVKKMIIIEG